MKLTSLNIIELILALPRVAKRSVVLAVDVSLCVTSVWLAFYLRVGDFISLWGLPLSTVIVSIFLALPIFTWSGLYKAIFRYSGWPALLIVFRAIAVYSIFFATIFTVVGVSGVPRTIGIIQPMLLLMFIGSSRALARFWLGEQYNNLKNKSNLPRVLIYGAGSSGRQLAGALLDGSVMRVLGFLDDDTRLQGQVLNGLSIHSPAVLTSLVEKKRVDSILLAMPTIGRRRRNEIIDRVRKAHVSVRTLPSFSDLAQGKVKVSDLCELDIDDLLGRESISPNNSLLSKLIKDKVVMVTGAGGSIGSELSWQISLSEPDTLLLIEQSEYALYAVHKELKAKLISKPFKLIPLIASVQDKQRIEQIISTWRPDALFHAAAYKHVPLVEHNLSEGIKNNVFGTLYVAEVAVKYEVANFVLVSTDKAVRPTNIMGASKRLAEMCLQALSAEQQNTNLSIVRFGNVLGSSGSVVPHFREQIKAGGPITLTHPDITRFFMTIREAAQLVVQAGSMSRGGEVFLLDMGEPVKIMELARRMIELSGLTVKDNENPNGDIELEIIGLRPGEKLFEELLIGGNAEKTEHPRIMRAQEEYISWSVLRGHLTQLINAVDRHDTIKVQKMLQKLVKGYTPPSNIVDWAYLQKTLMDNESSDKLD